MKTTHIPKGRVLRMQKPYGNITVISGKAMVNGFPLIKKTFNSRELYAVSDDVKVEGDFTDQIFQLCADGPARELAAKVFAKGQRILITSSSAADRLFLLKYVANYFVAQSIPIQVLDIDPSLDGCIASTMVTQIVTDYSYRFQQRSNLYCLGQTVVNDTNRVFFKRLVNRFIVEKEGPVIVLASPGEIDFCISHFGLTAAALIGIEQNLKNVETTLFRHIDGVIEDRVEERQAYFKEYFTDKSINCFRHQHAKASLRVQKRDFLHSGLLPIGQDSVGEPLVDCDPQMGQVVVSDETVTFFLHVAEITPKTVSFQSPSIEPGSPNWIATGVTFVDK